MTAEYDNYRRRSVSERQDAARQGRLWACCSPSSRSTTTCAGRIDAARRRVEAGRRLGPRSRRSARGSSWSTRSSPTPSTRSASTAIEAVGKPFDEDEHEAMMQQAATEDAASGTVLAEIQPGYRLGDRVVRHARVIVAE